jgi:hypothetical protein
MPKVKVSQKTKLQLYQREFEGEIVTTDNKILYCRACEETVGSEKRLQAHQHSKTNILVHKESIKFKSPKITPVQIFLVNFLVIVFHSSPLTRAKPF